MKGVLSWTRSLIFMNHSTVFVYRISFLFVSLWHPIFFLYSLCQRKGTCTWQWHVVSSFPMCTVLLGHAVFFGARLVQCAHVRSWRGNDAFCWFQVSISCVQRLGWQLRLACLLGGISSVSPPRSLARWRLSQLFTMSRATSPKIT